MLEKDVETAFIKWMDHEYTPFLGRQIKTPAGIIDCMFWDVNAAQPMVVEVKRGRTPAYTFAQLTAYMNFIREALVSQITYKLGGTYRFNVHGIIVAKSLDDMTRRALNNEGNYTFVKYTETENGLEFKITNIDEYFEDKTSVDGLLQFMKNNVENYCMWREQERCNPACEEARKVQMGGVIVNYYDRDFETSTEIYKAGRILGGKEKQHD